MPEPAADHYATLGLPPTAAAAEIEAAYRRLAAAHHPGLLRAPAEAAPFLAVQAAYAVLADPRRRADYDRQRPPAAGPGAAAPPAGDRFAAAVAAAAARPRRPRAGDDRRVELTLTLREVIAGAERPVTLERLEACADCRGRGAAPCLACGGDGRMPFRQTLAVGIPPGVDDGARLRLGGEGDAGSAGGPPGDLFVVLRVAPDPAVARAGDDLLVDLAITPAQAAAGALMALPTPEGPQSVTDPAGRDGGAAGAGGGARSSARAGRQPGRPDHHAAGARLTGRRGAARTTRRRPRRVSRAHRRGPVQIPDAVATRCTSTRRVPDLAHRRVGDGGAARAAGRREARPSGRRERRSGGRRAATAVGRLASGHGRDLHGGSFRRRQSRPELTRRAGMNDR